MAFFMSPERARASTARTRCCRPTAELAGDKMDSLRIAFEAGEARPSERALHRFDLETLYDIALLQVLIIGEGHAAFLPRHDLARIILEALQSRKLAFVDHNIIANQANAGAAAHHT